jgi:replicative DNA helicase
MELSLLRSLMNKNFYENHSGDRCPDKLFSKDVQKIKHTLDKAMSQFDRDFSPNEIEAVFMAENPTMTTANKDKYHVIFSKLNDELPMGRDIAESVLSKLFQQAIGEEIANLGFECVNGSITSLQPLRDLVDRYDDNFVPRVSVTWEDISFERLLESEENKYRWRINLSSLAQKIEGVSGGQLIEVGARPNTGKTSFHASLLAGKNGFIEQGANCVVLLNEEDYDRVIVRYLNASSDASSKDILKNKEKYFEHWRTRRMPWLKVKNATDYNMAWVESVCKYHKPDVVVLDMGDKFADYTSTMRIDEILKRNVVYARQIAKKYNCCIFYMSQLSAEAEGRVQLDQSMMEGSKTGKAAEADLMLLIARNPVITGQEEQDNYRYVNVVKNKLNGWHGMVTCEFDHTKALYTA